MLGQRRSRLPNNKPTLGQRRVFVGLTRSQLLSICACPANEIHRTNNDLMLGQRYRRWANINPELVQCLAFTG